MPSTPALTLPRRGGEETPAPSSPSQDASTGAEGLAIGWAPKPVAVLAIEATWPERTEAEGLPYEPWTVASRWEQRLAEKVAGFGGVILQGSPSLCLVAFGLPQTLEQLPQRAVQAALAIRQLAAEVQAVAGPMAGPVVRLAGHLGTLLVAEETEAAPGRWLAVGETLALPVRLLGQAAPGEVLVSAPIARLTEDWVEVQARPLPSGNEPSAQLLRVSRGATPATARPPDRNRDAGSPPVPGACTRAGRAAGDADARRRRPGAGGRNRGRARDGQVAAPRGVAPIPGRARGHLPGRALLVLRQRDTLPANPRPAAGALWHHA